MALRVITHGDVTQVCMSAVTGRAIGYDVSAFLVRGVIVDLGFPLVGRDFRKYLISARPDGALITHHHEDHGGNAELAATLGIPIGGGDATLAMLHEPMHLELHRRVIWGTPGRCARRSRGSRATRSASCRHRAMRPITTSCGTPNARRSSGATCFSA